MYAGLGMTPQQAAAAAAKIVQFRQQAALESQPKPTNWLLWGAVGAVGLVGVAWYLTK